MVAECVGSHAEVSIVREPKWKIGKVQIFLAKSGGQLRFPLTVLTVFSIAALVALGWTEYDMQRQIEQMREEAAVIQYENDLLEERTKELETVKSIEQIAQEELGMVTPGTILIEAQVK